MKFEVDRILKRKRTFAHPTHIAKIRAWRDFEKAPYAEDIAMVWRFIHEHGTPEISIREIARAIEMKDDLVAISVKELEARGWLHINRAVKPHVYTTMVFE